MVATKQAKTEYSQAEAAAELGISVEELHALIRTHVVKSEDELNAASLMTFQASDLLLIRLLSTSGLPGHC